MLSEKDLPGKKNKKEPEKEECANCHANAVQDDYCFGCKKFVCNKCSVNISLSMGHNVEDHWTMPANILG